MDNEGGGKKALVSQGTTTTTTTTTTTEASRLQRIAVKGLASLHILRGLLCLAYPAASSGLLSGLLVGGERSGATNLLSALVGVRDVLLGCLLATASGSHDVRRALAVNLVSDAADTFILIFAAACAWQRGATPVAEIGVVASVAILEHLTLWSLASGGGGMLRRRRMRRGCRRMRIRSCVLICGLPI
ncbi:hypothetical protein L249_4004 [Ophiocordyceps polyrhachis-furcata BCC 54312]|uniref:Uncharacterized protein n=1 Tax=Ophiocordyceps polyrhachis-furcata BCC 54312 TaxID=1330021 RepID=A0A367L5B4_9HYPO|nr:hypothetical protein L249_4004 [Ophiocordyceps polyrhachis-furcata BCC 54312]